MCDLIRASATFATISLIVGTKQSSRAPYALFTRILKETRQQALARELLTVLVARTIADGVLLNPGASRRRDMMQQSRVRW